MESFQPLTKSATASSTGDSQFDLVAAIDVKTWIARQEEILQQIAMQQDQNSGKLLAKLVDLSSRQESGFERLLTQQSHLESICSSRCAEHIDSGPWARSELPELHHPSQPLEHHVGSNSVASTRWPEQSLEGMHKASLSEPDHRQRCDRASKEKQSMATSDFAVVPQESSSSSHIKEHKRFSVSTGGGWSKMKRHIIKPLEHVDATLGKRQSIKDAEINAVIPSYEGSRNLQCSKKAISSPYFEPLCVLMLLSNALFIGASVEHRAQSASSSQEDLPVAYDVIEYVYVIWFTIELFMRCSAVGIRRFFRSREDLSWNIFDTFIVFVSILEKLITILAEDSGSGVIGNLSAIRAVRVCRVARLARVIRTLQFFRSFRILTSALFSTAKSCLWTSLLLCIILYMFALVFAQAVADYRVSIYPETITEDLRHYYGSLPRGMFTLFKSLVGGIDWEVAAQALSDVSGFYVLLFIMMLVFVYLAVMNVMTGLFLQNALEQASADKEDVIQEQLKQKKEYVHKVVQCFREIDTSGNETVTLDEFEEHLNDERMQAFLQALEIDMSDAWTLFRLLDVDGGGTVSISEFVDGCLRMRGTARSVHIAQLMYENKWTMEALVEIRKYMDQKFINFDHKFTDLEKQISRNAQPPPNDVHHRDILKAPDKSNIVLKTGVSGAVAPMTSAPLLPMANAWGWDEFETEVC